MNNKLHILFLCGWYPSRVLPTNGDFIERHARAVSLKHKVTVFHMITDNNCIKNMEVVSTKEEHLTVHIAYIKPQKIILKKILLFWKAYKLLLGKTDTFDVIHLNEIFPFGIFARQTSKKRNIPYLISEHFTGFLKTSNFKFSFLKKFISKHIIRNADTVCPVSNYLSENMQELGFDGNYVTVANVVDTDLFIPKEKDNKILKLVHVSSLKDEHKNIKGMLRVAKLLDEQVNDFEWKFIGNNGIGFKEFLKELNIKNGKISFIDHQTQEELVTNLQNASVCISFSNYETFGIVIPEAIACGTPVIATNTGITIDFSEYDFCQVIPIKNEVLLLQEILNSKKTFANLEVEKMHHFIQQQFSKEVISNKFSLLYYQSLKR
ncbi:glycosyltransferase [uncultured Polaribacter sp.]|uniref:glycosyltransferase family 4 protein n=1 Tax=uncultured Polaribacter sp. TaxID=174711 RepID=UPI00261764EE|nr:glycosyltransferase [uncultured Polaribacter sp.]